MIRIINEDHRSIPDEKEFAPFGPDMVIGDRPDFTLDFMARWWKNKMNNRERSIDRNDINDQFRQYLNYDEDMFKLMVRYARKLKD